MNKNYLISATSAICMLSACGSDKPARDRSDAISLFKEVTSLTESYTGKIKVAPDSASWAAVSTEFEDSLDKVNFRFPPDTDLLLTEGQNDTIAQLIVRYIKARDRRIHDIIHPLPPDTVAADTVAGKQASSK